MIVYKNKKAPITAEMNHDWHRTAGGKYLILNENRSVIGEINPEVVENSPYWELVVDYIDIKERVESFFEAKAKLESYRESLLELIRFIKPSLKQVQDDTIINNLVIHEDSVLLRLSRMTSQDEYETEIIKIK